MKQSIGFNQFHDAFRAHNRLDNFSYQGLRVLFDFFEKWDQDMETESELDVIAICCEFSEWDPDDIRQEYNVDHRGSDLIEWLNERTLVCGETSQFIIYADF